MPLTILPTTGNYAGAKYGVPNEVGINIERFVCRYYPEVNEVIPNYVGNTMLRVVSDRMSRDIQIEGEVLHNTGIMLFTVATVLTFANAVSHFGIVGGSFYFDEATVTASRKGWLSVSLKVSARGRL